MTYKTILLNVDIDGPVTSLIKFALELAKRFDAKLIGCSGADIVLPVMMGDGMIIDTGFIESQREAIEARLAHLRSKFLDLAGTGIDVEWRGDVKNPTELLTANASAADLIVTGSPEGAKTGDPNRSVDLGSLMLQVGRPVLVAAGGAEHLLARTVLVAWKDSREARRAVTDSIPFLKSANDVVVAAVERKDGEPARQGLADVVALLKRHGIKARSELLAGKNEGEQLLNLAASIHSDLAVAGAYGHSRLREWIFGGVTRSLLDDIKINRFMSN